MASPASFPSPGSPPFPDSLKPILVYLQRANELDQKQPLVAYYCRSYAAQRGIGLIPQGKDEKARLAAQTFLLALMDRLEKDKAVLNPDSEQGRAIVELFALKLFKNADDADRAGKFSKVISKLFFTSSVLMEVTRQFGELSEDISEKHKYARWKAAEISKALKDGTAPQPGPYGGEIQQQQQQQQLDDDDFTMMTANSTPPDIGAPPPAFDQQTRATHFSGQSSSPSYGTTQSVSGGKTTAPPPLPPDLTTYTNANENYRSQQQPPPPSQSSKQRAPTNSTAQTTRTTPPSAFVSAPTTSTVANTTTTPSKHAEPSIHDMMDAQKYAKYAVSALAFNDFRNARDNLRKALDLLGDA